MAHGSPPPDAATPPSARWPLAWRRAAAATLLVLLALSPPGALGAGKRTPEADRRWVAVSYGDLLDPQEMIRTGEHLRDAVKRPARRAAVQPFVERYSSLLPYAVAMLFGPDAAPQASLAEPFPAGSPQPAWAAILRDGRVQVTADGAGRARVFVPGDDPRAAYRRHYPLLRHPLARALPPGGGPLAVEVFAYRNEYSTSELLLNPTPYRFRATRFPPDRTPLDLRDLDRFFRQGGRLEGAELDPADGLILYASRGASSTLRGAAVELSDLAAAYRAAFHAGDNEAFVSLDPNPDPASATVNFGGCLEDTRIGQVVLAADKRFKTVCAGLDPETRADIRTDTRMRIPGFLTNSERAFLRPARESDAGWVGTRFWFYPGSAGVDSDRRFAAIVRPRFRADAERYDEGFLDKGARARKAALASEVRDNIALLNENYGRYAAAFPEIGELDGVARLMLLCSWLRRVGPDWLDLDALLGVELPGVLTPRQVPRLLTVTSLAQRASGPLDAGYVAGGAQVLTLNPALERTVADVFRNPMHLALFLAWSAGKEDAKPFLPAAEPLFEARKEERAGNLLKTEKDLRAFLRYASEVTAGVRRGAGGLLVALQHSGGISMNPRLFKVRQTPSSPALERLRGASRSAGTTWGKGDWIRSRPSRPEAAGAERRAPPAAPLAARARPAPVPRPSPVSGRPAPLEPPAEEVAPAPLPRRAVLKAIEVPAAPGSSPVVGRLAGDGRIVFTRPGP